MDANEKGERMLNRFTSLVLVSILLSTLGGVSAFASPPADPEVKTRLPVIPAATIEKTERPNEKLSADMLKLVAETKAGSKRPSAPAQLNPSRGNNLSKGKKIAIGVGIAAAVVIAVVAIHTRNHLFDGFNAFGR
jgi:hypothetical protein